MRSEFAMESVRQALLELVSVCAEKPLEGVSHDEKAHAVVQVSDEFLSGRPRISLSGERHRHGLRGF